MRKVRRYSAHLLYLINKALSTCISAACRNYSSVLDERTYTDNLKTNVVIRREVHSNQVKLEPKRGGHLYLLPTLLLMETYKYHIFRSHFYKEAVH